jgi:DNA-binding NarL/FixJ family response regulator
MAVRSTIRGPEPQHEAAGGTVVLLDEQPIWLDALEKLLASAGVRVVGKARSWAAALDLVEDERPDALVASVEPARGELDAIESLRRARERWPGLRIVALTAHLDPLPLGGVVGADVYLPKTINAEELTRAVCDCVAVDATGSRAREQGRLHQPSALTCRELEILQLVAAGYTNAQIAERLWVTKFTVKFHLANAYRKLGVSNRTQAARYVFDHGLSLDRPA